MPSFTGPYGGLLPPIPMAGMAFFPYGYASSDGTQAITANRIYYTPFPIFRTTTFAGARFADSGAGNNGFNVRLGIYAEASTGGPGTLLKDFGAAALTGTAGTHALANAVTVAGPQMCYVALLSDSAATLKCMGPIYESSAAGFIGIPGAPTLIGDFSATVNFTGNGATPMGLNAAQAYGALPGTATAPTTTVVNATSNGTFGIWPTVQLYL